MSRTQLAFNSGDLAFQEIITSRPNVNSATRVVSRNAVWPVTFPSTALHGTCGQDSIAKHIDLQFALLEMSPNQPPSEDSGPEGDDDEDTALLQQMLEEARNYILSFSWCESILGSYFAGGVGKVFAIFLFNISPARPDVDKWMWIVVGDIPPAYIPLEDCRTSREVFDTYIDGMKRWVQLAREGREAAPEDGVPHVNVPATREWAESLDGRLRSLAKLVQPLFQ